MRSFWLQHERKIDMFSFRDVETACRKHFPGLRMVRENRPDQRGWHNHKTRPCFRHKLIARLRFISVRKPCTRLRKYQTRLGSSNSTEPNCMSGCKYLHDSWKSS